VKQSESHSFSGSVAIKQAEKFSVKFVRTTAGEFDLTASTPIPQVSLIKVIESNPAIDKSPRETVAY